MMKPLTRDWLRAIANQLQMCHHAGYHDRQFLDAL
jgi:hypothetical protein